MKLKFLHDWLSKLVLLAGMVRQCSPAVTGSLHHMQTESVVELRCCIYVQFKIKLFFTTQIRTCIMMNPQNFLGNRHCSLLLGSYNHSCCGHFLVCVLLLYYMCDSDCCGCETVSLIWHTCTL